MWMCGFAKTALMSLTATPFITSPERRMAVLALLLLRLTTFLLSLLVITFSLFGQSATRLLG
jgi:hypothetical protein